MCQDCYAAYNNPLPGPAAIAVQPLIAAVYEHNSAGGNLHIVLEDWNLEDSLIARCVRTDDVTEAELACAQALISMPLEQRAAALALYRGYCLGDLDPGPITPKEGE